MNSHPLEILVVDDCQEDIDLIREVLSQQRVKNRLKVISNGEDAMEYLGKQGPIRPVSLPDVIVLDLNIPKKNGFEVLREITSDENLNKIPRIIFTTSDLTQETLQQYKTDAHQQYVKKSVDFREIAEAIKAIDQHLQRETLANRNTFQEQLKILLVEDSMEDAELIEELLYMKEKYYWTLKRAEQLQEALDYLSTEVFDVVVLDLFLPDSRGLETLKNFVDRKSSIPIVVMTGLKDENIGKKAIHEGAQDYIIKGQITADLFTRVVEYAIERKKLERMKDELLSYVNHELSNPLMVIKEGVSQIAEGFWGEINPKQKIFLDTAISSINRLITITEDLLINTKIELGKVSLVKERFDFHALIDETTETFKAAFAQKGVELKSRLPLRSVEIYADRDRMGQVLTNLLNNALKHTAKGYVEIVLEINDYRLQCSIIDTGEGIASEDIPRLFQKYEQLLSDKRKTQKGTGLGLFICKALIELHDGTIAVTSQLGKGSQFVLTLPIEKGA
jgi:signal transduction histidine kinase